MTKTIGIATTFVAALLLSASTATAGCGLFGGCNSGCGGGCGGCASSCGGCATTVSCCGGCGSSSCDGGCGGAVVSGDACGTTTTMVERTIYVPQQTTETRTVTETQYNQEERSANTNANGGVYRLRSSDQSSHARVHGAGPSIQHSRRDVYRDGSSPGGAHGYANGLQDRSGHNVQDRPTLRWPLGNSNG